MSKEIKAYDETKLPLEIDKHYNDLTYDFSNFYFLISVWKKEFIEKFGEIPSTISASARKVMVFQNAISKEWFTELPKDGIIIAVQKNHEHYYQVKYIPELNCIGIETWYVDLYRNAIIKSDCYYIDEKKNLYVRNYRTGHFEKVTTKTYAKTVEFACTGTCLHKCVDDMFNDAFKDLFPIAFCGANRYMFVRNGWQLASFLAQKEVSKRNGPKQEKIDELCKIELPDPKIKKYEKEEKYTWYGKQDIVVIASKVNEEYAVLRWFKKDTKNERSIETARLFVSKKEVTFCRINSFGEFIYINGKLDCTNFKAGEYIVESEDVFNGTKLEYFQSCAEEVKNEQKCLLLWLFCYYPIAEKMWKSADYKKIPYTFVTENSWGKFSDVLQRHFGYVDENAKNINKGFGINSYQAKILLEDVNLTSYSSKNAIRSIKNGLRMKDISSIDNNTFDALCTLVKHLSKRSYYMDDTMYYLYKNYSLKGIVRVAEDFEAVGGLEYRDLSFYCDYLKMADQIGDTVNFKPYFKSRENVQEMHDAIMAIYDLKRNAIKVEAFNKQSAKWKKWAYNKNSDFTVIAPTLPNDLAKEGMALRHCVKSYIDRVAEGRTNIMFIRKKSALDEPFFTVEISNDSTIEQVHGFGNRNADTEPKLPEFVSEWAKACKLKPGGYNKIR